MAKAKTKTKPEKKSISNAEKKKRCAIEYGNNFCCLETGNGNIIYMCLLDPITISCKAEWEPTIAATFAEKARSQFLTNPFLEGLGALVGSPIQTVLGEDYTQRMYKCTDFISFDLKFRAYQYSVLTNISSDRSVFDYLRRFAVPSGGGAFNQAFDKIATAVGAAIPKVKAIAGILVNDAPELDKEVVWKGLDAKGYFDQRDEAIFEYATIMLSYGFDVTRYNDFWEEGESKLNKTIPVRCAKDNDIAKGPSVSGTSLLLESTLTEDKLKKLIGSRKIGLYYDQKKYTVGIGNLTEKEKSDLSKSVLSIDATGFRKKTATMDAINKNFTGQKSYEAQFREEFEKELKKSNHKASWDSTDSRNEELINDKTYGKPIIDRFMRVHREAMNTVNTRHGDTCAQKQEMRDEQAKRHDGASFDENYSKVKEIDKTLLQCYDEKNNKFNENLHRLTFCMRDDIIMNAGNSLSNQDGVIVVINNWTYKQDTFERYTDFTINCTTHTIPFYSL